MLDKDMPFEYVIQVILWRYRFIEQNMNADTCSNVTWEHEAEVVNNWEKGAK